jgi:hypothetical protein
LHYQSTVIAIACAGIAIAQRSAVRNAGVLPRKNGMWAAGVSIAHYFLREQHREGLEKEAGA